MIEILDKNDKIELEKKIENAGKSATADAEAAAASATAAQTAQGKAETAQGEAEKSAETAAASASAAQTAQGKAETAATNAGKSATAAAGSATTASNAATAAQSAQGKAETAQAAAESAKSTASQKATEATTAAQTATSKATEASQSATAAGTAKTAAQEAAARAEEAANRLLGVAVVGVIDENGNLILTGLLEDGTYTAYYEVDGELVEIGDLTLGSVTPDPVTYTVTFVADGVTVSTKTYTVENPVVEEPAVPVKEGYTGIWETYDLTKGGNITVNAVYTAIEPEPAEPKNFAQPLTVGRLSNGATGNVSSDNPDSRVTAFVDVKKGDVVYVDGFTQKIEGTSFMTFDSAKSRIGSLTGTSSFTSEYAALQSTTDTGAIVEIISDAVAYVRFSDNPSGNEDDIKVNIKRNGEWRTE